MQEPDRDESLLAEEPWRAPLESLERKLSELRKAVSVLRDALEESEETGPHLQAVSPKRAPSTPLKTSSELWGHEIGAGDNKESFTAVWDRIKKEAQHESDAAKGEEVEAAKTETPEEASGSEEAEASLESDAPAEDPAEAKFKEVWQRLQSEQGAGEEAEGGKDAEEEAAEAKPTNLKDIWDKLQRDREGGGDDPFERVAGDRGLPHEYRMTIEDRDGTPVDLVPLNRALRAFASPEDVTLLSHANGAAVISMRTKEEIDIDELGTAVGLATSRACEVIPQDQGKLFLRLSVEEGADEGDDG